jgi:RNA polymerase sigma factor (sigma-70 family)
MTPRDENQLAIKFLNENYDLIKKLSDSIGKRFFEKNPSDIAHDISIIILEKSIHSIRDPRTYLATLITRHILNAKRKRTRDVQKNIYLVERKPQDDMQSVKSVETRDEMALLMKIVQKLTPAEREALRAFILDVSPSEVAASKGEKLETVRTRLRRALEKVRETRLQYVPRKRPKRHA